jgi:hypothetical protein
MRRTTAETVSPFEQTVFTVDQKEIKIIQLREGLWSLWETQIDTVLEMQGSAKWLDRNMASVQMPMVDIGERPTFRVASEVEQWPEGEAELMEAQAAQQLEVTWIRMEDIEQIQAWEARRGRLEALSAPITWRQLILERYMEGKNGSL